MVEKIVLNQVRSCDPSYTRQYRTAAQAPMAQRAARQSIPHGYTEDQGMAEEDVRRATDGSSSPARDAGEKERDDSYAGDDQIEFSPATHETRTRFPAVKEAQPPELRCDHVYCSGHASRRERRSRT